MALCMKINITQCGLVVRLQVLVELSEALFPGSCKNCSSQESEVINGTLSQGHFRNIYHVNTYEKYSGLKRVLNCSQHY